MVDTLIFQKQTKYRTTLKAVRLEVSTHCRSVRNMYQIRQKDIQYSFTRECLDFMSMLTKFYLNC